MARSLIYPVGLLLLALCGIAFTSAEFSMCSFSACVLVYILAVGVNSLAARCGLTSEDRQRHVMQVCFRRTYHGLQIMRNLLFEGLASVASRHLQSSSGRRSVLYHWVFVDRVDMSPRSLRTKL